ncbi:lysM and putative peptidoglycan-binding domain-containing protein 1 [Bufo gargarizans]|uniref:lysM and putative peptidoglycan-binding domain-containing protein 1 n=1 Tax=Bufo gargarizans TaxID=30331 RepID=UPI001CF12E5F|nr:lysM and putative peptidoglycan-binding domain-containing protein 1 [Bufo gargarizans]
MASRDGDSGLLRGPRARSYGSLVQSSYSPARVRKVEHLVQPGDTLPGLALKYGVTIEQIKRANRLYTNDSIFLKKYLSIPVLTEQPELTNGAHSTAGQGEKEEGAVSRPQRSASVDSRKGDVSVVDFMSKLDTRIRVSKRAAVKKIREAESVAQEEDSSTDASYQGLRRQDSPQTAQRSLLGPVPLTIITRATTLRDREDEIFKL